MGWSDVFRRPAPAAVPGAAANDDRLAANVGQAQQFWAALRGGGAQAAAAEPTPAAPAAPQAAPVADAGAAGAAAAAPAPAPSLADRLGIRWPGRGAADDGADRLGRNVDQLRGFLTGLAAPAGAAPEPAAAAPAAPVPAAAAAPVAVAAAAPPPPQIAEAAAPVAQRGDDRIGALLAGGMQAAPDAAAAAAAPVAGAAPQAPGIADFVGQAGAAAERAQGAIDNLVDAARGVLEVVPK